LIRRLAFALTGLPPTLDEVDRFLSDQSPTAYEDLVEYYLHSPAYGEEMARHWLDVARYADTHGLHLDNEREMWAYRDWVIRMFDANLPFDEFTIWQLAGDLLPNPTNDQLIATGFCRCNVTTSEGGALDDEYRFLYAIDRTSTMIETWMGLTGGCAVCHDHKFDPLSTREYYSLYAFFNNAADPPMDKNIARTTPFLPLPGAGEQAAIAVAEQAVAQRREALQQLASQVGYRDPVERLESKSTSTMPDQPWVEVVLDDLFPYGSSPKNTTRNPAVWDLAPHGGAKSGRRSLKQASSYFTEDTFDTGGQILLVTDAGRLSFWVCLDPRDTPKILAVSLKQGSDWVAYWGEASLDDYGFPTKSQAVHQGAMPKAGCWVELTVDLESVGLKAGQPISSIALQQAGGVLWWDRVCLEGFVEVANHPAHSFSAWWQGARGKSIVGLPPKLAATLKAGPDKIKDADAVADLTAFYLAHIAVPRNEQLAAARRAWEEALTQWQIAQDQVRGTMIFGELPEPRASFVMERGQYDKPTIEVQPGVPAVLPPLKSIQPSDRPNRLDLARWLTDPRHPLTARVTVNRFWQQFFGTGLVKTSHDFGSQGEPPSHSELLDWLAIDFRDQGWDVKRLVRLLVTSQAFRRDATVDPLAYQRDPENRYYARGPRFRLDAEQIRDAALFVSSLLSTRRGGRGAMPYQPPNIWEPVGYQNSNTRYYLQGHGDDLYRRSIYCFLKRTAPPPFMSNFDGPNREQFCTRRERSNTPLQALQLLNDVQHIEAARALAERVLASTADDGQKLAELFRRVLSRHPDAAEQRLLLRALGDQRRYYQSKATEASRLIHSGESLPRRLANDSETAAWTMVANMVLNLDEAISRN
jgi:hypothetical protein